ncbi:non-specific lipid transfer protein GPI-anchored 25 [Gossypium arboreum]|uniref:Bifunctional inhibitor/plant lipid transfer protein/seed storage helical domain-containing protein n=1 Tax=Gossypium arboreum TaxID=29729 RepID=A0ABR0NUL2_GOSAR|nr:non-specific lipid transfer protein GPI-anchored 25 [Gossypium arboreum]KAK5804991.1 hypothetical protein PVK06_032643 [Gossypium arboreum]
MAANIFILLLLGVAAQPLPPAPQQPGCVEELVAFSPCLPFVSDPPNNATDSVAPQCCDVFNSAFDSGDGYCFCYILRQPRIFGFPLNRERVASLSSFCMAKNSVASLDSLCSSGAPALPPLPSTTDSGILKPFNSRLDNDSTSSPPESPVKSLTPPSSSVEEAVFSSATNQIYKHIIWFLLGMVIFLLTLHSFLV